MDAALVRGLWLMALAIFTLSSMDVFAKVLIESGVHTVTILAVRSVIIAGILLTMLACKGQVVKLRTRRPGAHLLRGVCGLTAVGGFFTSLNYLPLADATVIFFTGTLFVAIASVVVLKESFGAHRWLAVVAGYVGVAIALKPDMSSLGIGYLYAFVGSLSYAGLFISGKILSKTESTISLVFYFNAGLGMIALAMLPFFWAPLSLKLWAMIVAVSLLALIGHLAITQAFSTTDASVLAPVEYTSLLWAILFDYLIWAHTPASRTLIGGAVVVLSGLYFLYRERQASKENQPARSPTN